MPPKGWHPTPESRARMSAAALGRTLSPETREKMSAARTGVSRGPLSPEHRARLAESHRGHIPTAETRAKMSAARAGVPRSPETRARIGRGHLGLTHTPEARAKIAAARAGITLGHPGYEATAPIKGECVYCFAPARGFDHVIPRGRDGWDDPDNVVPCCQSCNSAKNDRTPAEWFAAQ